ncbi:MAG: HEAT repeat domain-containing protein, partial [Bacillota bacterium]|nr:HEAT repeat domain-containing protein [Bacillota bacterium]
MAETYAQKLIAALEHPDPAVRRRAAWLLGRRRETGAVEALLAAVAANAGDPYLLETVVEALGLIGDPRALGTLTELLRSSYLPVRVRAARALGRLGGAAAREALRE